MKGQYVFSASDRILITGSSGFIGTKVVETLLEYGFVNLRCFVRSSSRLDRLRNVLRERSGGEKVELFSGDLASMDDCRRATEGVSLIYHLATGFDKSFAGAFMNSALITRNLIQAFLRCGEPKRFVNVSSFAVYSNLRLRRGAILDETCPLEEAPNERYDAYAFGKLKQEELLKEYATKHELSYVTLRPGTVFGPGKKELSGRVGINTFGFFIQVSGANVLPLTFVDNCADAIVLAGLKPGVEGEIFNIVDDTLLSSRQFLQAYKKRLSSFFSVRVPYWLAYLGCSLWEHYSRQSKGQIPPVFNRRRCAAEWKRHAYSNQKLRDGLGWKPKVDMKTAMASFLAQFE
jgi:nucleoside-diphosphate-sugar epimerase